MQTWLTIVVASSILAVLIGSFWLWLQIWQRWRQGEAILSYWPRAPVRWEPLEAIIAVIAWFVLRSAAVAVLAVAARRMGHEPGAPLLVQGLVLGNLVAVAVIPMILAITQPLRPTDLGVRTWQFSRQVRTGLLGLLTSYLPVMILLLIMAGLNLRTEETEHAFLTLVREGDLALVLWIAVAAVVAAPLSEELVFRSVLQGTLERHLTKAWAIGIPAVAFAAVHGWPDMLPLLPLSLVLGYIYHRQRSFVAVVVLHAAFNLSMLLWALALQYAQPAG